LVVTVGFLFSKFLPINLHIASLVQHALKLSQGDKSLSFTFPFADMAWQVNGTFFALIFVFTSIDIGFPITELTAVIDHDLQHFSHLL
jgi:hypothetical protein